MKTTRKWFEDNARSLLLLLSLTLNTALVVALHTTNNEHERLSTAVSKDYERLQVWACNHGNGGHECGED